MEKRITLKIRIDEPLLQRMMCAAACYRITYSEMARMAQRRYNRLKPAITEELGTSGPTTPIRLQVIEEMPAQKLRAVLDWFLNEHARMALDAERKRADMADLEAKYGSLSDCLIVNHN